MPTSVDYVATEAKVEEFKSGFADYFTRYDALLCPINPFTAPRHHQDEVMVNGKPVSVGFHAELSRFFHREVSHL